MPIETAISLAILFVTVLGSGLLLAYRLGVHASRIDKIEQDREELKATVVRIFEKLDTLSVAVPHRCYQVERLAKLEAGIEKVSLDAARQGERMRILTLEHRKVRAAT